MNWWLGLKAMKRYAVAKATGDVAPYHEQARRLGICAACPARRLYRETSIAGLKVVPMTLFCGSATVPTLDTCGCLLGAQAVDQLAQVTVDGVPMVPAGKTEIGSERCPRGAW